MKEKIVIITVSEDLAEPGTLIVSLKPKRKTSGKQIADLLVQTALSLLQSAQKMGLTDEQLNAKLDAAGVDE